MFTDKTQIEHMPSFADEIEALQPKIRQAREEMKKRGGLRVVTQMRDAEEAERLRRQARVRGRDVSRAASSLPPEAVLARRIPRAVLAFVSAP